MTFRTPVIVDGSGNFSALSSSDTLPATAIGISRNAGNLLNAASDGSLFASPPPFLTWEIGTTLQPNGGKGIDEGTWWRLDLSVQPNGSIPGASITSDGYLQLQPGFYLITFDGVLNTTASTGQYKSSFMTSRQYGYPGIYQDSIINYANLNGSGGAISLSMSRLCNCNIYTDVCSFGYDKGSDGSAALHGFISVIQFMP
jgi:hypothetical protein